MVSPELIRRFPFFGGLTIEQVVALAKYAEEIVVEKDHYFFDEGDDLSFLYILVEGEVSIVTKLPQKDKEVKFDHLGVGDVFGWSSLVPPHASTAGAKTITPCRVIAFDAHQLQQEFEKDCQFGYLLILKIAQLIRERLESFRIETIAYIAD